MVSSHVASSHSQLTLYHVYGLAKHATHSFYLVQVARHYVGLGFTYILIKF